MGLELEIVKKVIKIINLKEINSKNFKDPKRDKAAFNKKKLRDIKYVEEKYIDGRQVVSMWETENIKKHVVYFHGGAYVGEGNGLHRILAKKLIKSYGVKVSFIDYPTAPEYDAIDTMDFSLKAYSYLKDRYKEDEYYLFGNSAGGGIALSLLRILKREKDARVKGAILASPWLDVSLSNKDIDRYKDRDIILPLDTLREAGLKYAGRLSTRDELVSPIYGDLSDLGDILLWIGNEEVFYHDTLVLKDKISKSKGSKLYFYEIENVFHDFILAPIRERNQILDIMNDFIYKENETI